ncbi:MAG: hypothetical protein HKL80_03205, partial [Acidimicrobiales bacterium]|nr:hypothetical protein [Acidimicrobiales bacterium]
PHGAPVSGSLRPGSVLVVPAPPALAQAAGFHFPYLPFPLGTLVIQGTPQSAWTQSTAPTDAEVAAITLYQDAIYAAMHGRNDWWNQIAPKVAYSSVSQLVGSSKVGYLNAVDPVITVKGTSVTNFQIVTTIAITGGPEPGHYSLTVGESANDRIMTVTSWTMNKI